LLDFIPDSLTIIPGEAHPDRLTREVIQRLQAANPPAGSAAAEFLDLLSKADPVAEVKTSVSAYHAASSRPGSIGPRRRGRPS
jgi:hypothetical protein